MRSITQSRIVQPLMLFGVATRVALACGLAFASPSMAATRARRVVKPVAGTACSPGGARAPGSTSLDCVRVGSKLVWEPKGSKLNPFRFGEVFEWTQAIGKETNADSSTRRIIVRGYLADASAWVNNYPDNHPQDIFDAANGVTIRGVQVDYTLVNATNGSQRDLGSLSEFWLGDDRDAGCCGSGLLKWADPPAEGFDPQTSLDDGTTQTGVLLFARTDVQIGTKPLMRLGWSDVRTGSYSYVYFAMT